MSKPPVDTGEIHSPVGVIELVLTFVRVWALRYMFGKGVLFALLGMSWIVQPIQKRVAGIAWIEMIEPWMIGVLWMAAGIWAVIASRTRSRTAHRTGWFGLITVSAITALYFTVAWVISLLPLAAEGAPHGWISALSYGAFAMAYCVSKIQIEMEEISTAWGED